LLGGLIGVLCGIGSSHVVGMVADFKAMTGQRSKFSSKVRQQISADFSA